jgi:ferredoxin
LPVAYEFQESDVAYIICEPCVGTKDTACVDVCPVDCIHPRKDEPEFQTAEMLYIHPDECIDCGACEPECPTTAIFEESELPTKWAVYKDINALVSGAKKAAEVDTASWPDHLKSAAPTADTWPNITEQKKALPGADDAAKEENKIAALTLEGGSE